MARQQPSKAPSPDTQKVIGAFNALGQFLYGQIDKIRGGEVVPTPKHFTAADAQMRRAGVTLSGPGDRHSLRPKLDDSQTAALQVLERAGYDRNRVLSQRAWTLAEADALFERWRTIDGSPKGQVARMAVNELLAARKDQFLTAVRNYDREEAGIEKSFEPRSKLIYAQQELFALKDVLARQILNGRVDLSSLMQELKHFPAPGFPRRDWPGE